MAMETDSNDLPDNVLFRWYRRYIGEPDGRTDVYLGFGLFFGGIALALIAMVLFFYTVATMERPSDAYFTWRTAVYALGMLAPPMTLSGVVVLLPVEKRAVYATTLGSVATAAAVALFVEAYPYQFNVSREPDYSGWVVGVYALGIAAVVASTGAALVAHHLERAAPGPAAAVPEDGTEDDEAETEHYSDDRIQSDIDEAMADVDITWGGVAKNETTRLTINADVGDVGGPGVNVEPERKRSAGVDAQVDGLKQLKGGEMKTDSGTDVDDQTAALTELKQRRGDGETPPDPAGTTDGDGLLDRMRGLLN